MAENEAPLQQLRPASPSKGSPSKQPLRPNSASSSHSEDGWLLKAVPGSRIPKPPPATPPANQSAEYKVSVQTC